MARPALEILGSAATPLGELVLRRRSLLQDPDTVVTEITLDHELLMSSLHTDSERRLAREALAWHGGDALRVLVGGLGLGFTAHEVLRSPRVAEARVVELLPEVIAWLDEGLFELSEVLRGDARLAIERGDVYARLLGPPPGSDARFDLVLVDVDHAPDEPLGTVSGGPAFHSREGLVRAKEHLAPGGVLGVWSYAESSSFVDALRASFDTLRVVPVTFENRLVHETETDWLFLARDTGPAARAAR